MGEVFLSLGKFYLNAPGDVVKLPSPTRDVKFFEVGQKFGGLGTNFYTLQTASMG